MGPPWLWRTWACSGRRTRLTRPIPSVRRRAEHLAEVGGRCGVHEGRVSLAAHCLDHPECGEGVDERRGAVGGGGAVRQGKAGLRCGQGVLGVGAVAGKAHHPAEKRLGLRCVPGGDDDARALVADRHGAADSRREAAHGGFGHLGGDDGAAVGLVGARRFNVRHCEQRQPQVEGLRGAASTRTRT